MAKQENNRMRTTIPVSGLDTSTPDQTVTDGKCEELHNLRWETGSWHNIDPLKISHNLQAVGEGDEPINPPEFIYHHPAAGDGHYIATVFDNNKAYLYHMKVYDDNTVSFNNDIDELRLSFILSANFRLTHFGNILIVIDDDNQNVAYFYWQNNRYELFFLPAPPVVRQSTQYALHSDSITPAKDYTPIWRAEPKMDSVNRRPESKLFDRTNSLFHYDQICSDNPMFFWGEICYFAAFQMADGSLLCPSPLNISSSEALNTSNEGRAYNELGHGIKYLDTAHLVVYPDYISVRTDHVATGAEFGDDYSYYFATVFGINIRPRIEITIPNNINTDLIKSVSIYSTRINPIWDAEKLINIAYPQSGNKTIRDFTKYFAENRLPEQPFYFVKSIPVSDFADSSRTYQMYLGADLLKDIEQNTQYVAVDAHSITHFKAVKEYNSRLHIGQPTLRLFAGQANTFFDPSEARPERYAIATEIKIDNKSYFLKTPSKIGFIDDYDQEEDPETTPWGRGDNRIRNKIVSYPDHRAVCLYDMNKDALTASHEIALRPTLTANMAWATCSDDYVKYSTDFTTAARQSTRGITLNDRLQQANKLRVSASNNPFSFPLANSYAIGTENNCILAVNSAAIEMSDAKFGEFPLFVFTEEGIFTLQSGSGEVLYSATIPLNYDRIVNPETLAVNHNVLYVTARGVQAMFSNESKLISEPLNDQHNTPPLYYLRTAKMCYQSAHNEVIIWNPAHAIGRSTVGTCAYVFSLDGGYWSTRDFEGIKLNTAELVVRKQPNTVLILNLDQEEPRPGQAVSVRLVTRPVKLGTVEFKRLETFIPRLNASEPQLVRLLFEGSTNLKTWTVLRDTGFFKTDRDTTLRRFPGSVRYLRITFEATISAEFELTGFDLEYYLRFLHRLR